MVCHNRKQGTPSSSATVSLAGNGSLATPVTTRSRYYSVSSGRCSSQFLLTSSKTIHIRHMPPPRKHIDPCGIEGHKIESLIKGVAFVSPGKAGLSQTVMVDDRTVLCTKCGKTLDDIRAEGKEATVANS